MFFRIFFVRLFTSEDQNTYYKFSRCTQKWLHFSPYHLGYLPIHLPTPAYTKRNIVLPKKPSNWCKTFNLFTSAPLHRLSWNHHDSFQCHPLMSRPLLHQLLSKHLGKHFYSNEDNELHLQVTNIIKWIFLLEKSQPCI